jgi:hypothetical protein
VRRCGVTSSNASEQFNGQVVPELSEPVCDLVASLLAKMADNAFIRGTTARKRVAANKLLVPRCEYEHKLVIAKARKYSVFFNVATDVEVHANVRSPSGTDLLPSPHPSLI